MPSSKQIHPYYIPQLSKPLYTNSYSLSFKTISITRKRNHRKLILSQKSRFWKLSLLSGFFIIFLIAIVIIIPLVINAAAHSNNTSSTNTTSSLNNYFPTNAALITSISIASTSTSISSSSISTSTIAVSTITTSISTSSTPIITSTTSLSTTSTSVSTSTTSITTSSTSETTSTTSTSETTSTTSITTSSTSETTSTTSYTTSTTSITTSSTSETTSTTSYTTSTTSITTSSTSETTSTTSDTTSTTSITTSSTSTSTMNPLRWNTTGAPVAGLSGTIGSAFNRLNFPIGLVIDSSDILYAADSRNNRILQFTIGNLTGKLLAGQGSGSSGSSSNYLFYPNDFCLDSTGHLYIADTNNSRIQMWTLGSSPGITILGNGSGLNFSDIISSPRGIAMDTNTGTIYISDANNHCIIGYKTTTNTSTIVAGCNGAGVGSTQLFDPRGLYFDSSTNSLLIANSGAHNIVRWKIGASNWTLVVGSPQGILGNNSVSLYGPWDVILDYMGNLYVADRYNSRIQFFLPGQINGTTIAGTTGISGASATVFNTPLSIALDSQLNLYVADSWNHRIQKFQRY